MKLLILTQKVDINDDILGFFHGWIKEFAKHCEKVIVICLQKGEHELPENVRVLSLGKEKHFSKKCDDSRKLFYCFIVSLFHCYIVKLLYCCRFYKYIWQERKNYDGVFVHMNKEYVILGGLFWRILGKKVGFWYAHGSLSFILRVAEKFADIIFTSTKSGCRLKSRKIKVVGQGIDVNKFSARGGFAVGGKIITIGRISPVKDYETLIKAVEILLKNKAMPRSCDVDIIGGLGLKGQEEYLNKLKKIVKNKGLDRVINFVGSVPNKDITQYLQSADLFVNTSHTGSLDKAILEAMSCGLPVLTCNEALEDVLGEYKNVLMFGKGDYKKLAERIRFLLELDLDEKSKISKNLRNIVVKEHDLRGLVYKILDKFLK